MKRLVTMSSVLFAGILFVGGCGNASKEAGNDNRDKTDTITTDEKQGGNRDTGDAYGFNDFDLEIDVDNKDVIDAEYKVEKDFEPEYENTMTSLNLTGKKAMDELDKLFINTNLQSKMSGEEARDVILKYFQIDKYSKFELDIHFDDGTNLKYKDGK